MMGGQSNERGGENTMVNVYKQKLFQKKIAKVTKLAGDGKKYKKYLIKKKFEEDNTPNGKMKKEKRVQMTEYVQKLYSMQKAAKNEESKEQKPEQEILDVIDELDPSYLSDLKPEDIPDDAVSDVEQSTGLGELEEEAKGTLIAKMANQDKKAEEENMKFMQDFVTLYATDSAAAKASYYKIKVDIDVGTSNGQAERKRMLKKYLEGMQWVLYYYYRGAQHWRWYYPYHYAPLICDLGDNLVKDFLGSKTVISEFEIDTNCPTEKRPYTPF